MKRGNTRRDTATEREREREREKMNTEYGKEWAGWRHKQMELAGRWLYRKRGRCGGLTG